MSANMTRFEANLRSKVYNNVYKDQLFNKFDLTNNEGKISGKTVKIWTDTEWSSKNKAFKLIDGLVRRCLPTTLGATLGGAITKGILFGIATGVGVIAITMVAYVALSLCYDLQVWSQEALKTQKVWAQITGDIDAFENLIGFDPQQTGIQDPDQFKADLVELANNLHLTAEQVKAISDKIKAAIISKHQYDLKHPAIPQGNPPVVAVPAPVLLPV